jgi:hypothetical protein
MTRFISALQCAFGFARALLLIWSLLLVKLWTELVFLRQLQAVVGFDFGAKHWCQSGFGLCLFVCVRTPLLGLVLVLENLVQI